MSREEFVQRFVISNWTFENQVSIVGIAHKMYSLIQTTEIKDAA